MRIDDRDILNVLKAELAFLKKGGYNRSTRDSWRQPLIFEDSPTCANFGTGNHEVPCSECVLFQLVPPQFRGKQIPCRHIALNAEHETLDSLSRYSHQSEIEDIFEKWLRKTIADIESERNSFSAALPAPSIPPRTGGASAPLGHNLHPKCANNACSNAFRWLAGGKFFRFRPDTGNTPSKSTGAAAPLGISGIEHFWLCERCSHIFTLAFDETQGVVLKLRSPELLAAEHPKQLISG